MGGIHSVLCNDIAKRIREFALQRGFWVSSSHISGVGITIVDKMSRIFNANTEWMPSHNFLYLCHKFEFNPQVDLFVTHLNRQIDKYISLILDPYYIAVNSINFRQKPHKIYWFPPFSLVGAAISKLHGNHEFTQVDNTVLASDNAFPSGRTPPLASFRFKRAFLTIKTIKSSPTFSEASVFSSHPIGQSLTQFELIREIEEVIVGAWKTKIAA